MRSLTTVSLLAGIAVSGPALGALSPYYQSIAEIQRILADPRLSEALVLQEAVRSITSPQPDVYELRTDRCTVTDRIVIAKTILGVITWV